MSTEIATLKILKLGHCHFLRERENRYKDYFAEMKKKLSRLELLDPPELEYRTYVDSKLSLEGAIKHLENPNPQYAKQAARHVCKLLEYVAKDSN
jgi:hypothetical protein